MSFMIYKVRSILRTEGVATPAWQQTFTKPPKPREEWAQLFSIIFNQINNMHNCEQCFPGCPGTDFLANLNHDTVYIQITIIYIYIYWCITLPSTKNVLQNLPENLEIIADNEDSAEQIAWLKNFLDRCGSLRLAKSQLHGKPKEEA